MADASLPSPPFIFVEGLPNFRDIGGYPIAAQPGKVVRPGIVFRSSEPSKLTDQGIATLQELKVTDVYDLRSQQELSKDAKSGHGRQPKEWEGSRRIFAPVFLDLDYSPEAIALRFKNYADKSSEVSKPREKALDFDPPGSPDRAQGCGGVATDILALQPPMVQGKVSGVRPDFVRL